MLFFSCDSLRCVQRCVMSEKIKEKKKEKKELEKALESGRDEKRQTDVLCCVVAAVPNIYYVIRCTVTVNRLGSRVSLWTHCLQDRTDSPQIQEKETQNVST